MKTDDALKLTDAALDSLADALSEGHSQTLTKYLETLSRFHNYSFGNVLLIASQKEDATHVAGYQTWRKLGRQVKKGEKGIAILAPLVYRKKSDESSVTAVSNDEAEKKTVRGFKVVHVFDVTQTDGEALPEFAKVTGSPGEYLARIRADIEARHITLSYEHIAGGALGISESGSIRVRPDLEPAEEFSVLVHELAHELLHKGARREETTKTIRETEAEAVSFVVSHAIGLEGREHSSDYIRLYRGGKDTLSESLEHIQKTAQAIIQVLSAG